MTNLVTIYKTVIDISLSRNPAIRQVWAGFLA